MNLDYIFKEVPDFGLGETSILLPGVDPFGFYSKADVKMQRLLELAGFKVTPILLEPSEFHPSDRNFARNLNEKKPFIAEIPNGWNISLLPDRAQVSNGKEIVINQLFYRDYDRVKLKVDLFCDQKEVYVCERRDGNWDLIAKGAEESKLILKADPEAVIAKFHFILLESWNCSLDAQTA